MFWGRQHQRERLCLNTKMGANSNQHVWLEHGTHGYSVESVVGRLSGLKWGSTELHGVKLTLLPACDTPWFLAAGIPLSLKRICTMVFG